MHAREERDDDDANIVGLREWGTLRLDHSRKLIRDLGKGLRSKSYGTSATVSCWRWSLMVTT